MELEWRVAVGAVAINGSGWKCCELEGGRWDFSFVVEDIGVRLGVTGVAIKKKADEEEYSTDDSSGDGCSVG
jgi:hypothetical protein